jgi:hypothetical protein
VQVAVVAVLVSAAFAYAAWMLMPAFLRRLVAGLLLRVAPESLHERLEGVRSGTRTPGCSSCKACPSETKSAPDNGARPIRLHRRHG